MEKDEHKVNVGDGTPSGPRVVDDATDELGREYSDAVLERLGGGLVSQRGDSGAVPKAGAGPTYQDGIPTYGPQQFARDGEAYIGGATVRDNGDFVASNRT